MCNGFLQGLALIFDMDGVILDSNPVHREAWAAYNRRHGIETTEAMHEFMYGKRNDEIVRGFYGAGLPMEEVEERGAAKERLYREMIGDRWQEMMVPGVREFLDRNHATPTALATNAEPANVEFLLSRSGLAPYFQAVVDGHQVHRPKPDPEIYLLAAQLLETPPANCIVFEDSHTGVAAARAAGARVIGIRTTHGNLPGADLSVDNFQSGELESWLAAQTPLV